MLPFLKTYDQKPVGQKKKSSKSATYTAENPAEGTSSTTVDISDDYLSLIKASFEIRKMEVTKKSKLFKKRNRTIKWIETKTEKLSQQIIDGSVDAKFDDIIALAVVCYNLGRMYADEDIEIIAEKYYMRCVELLKGRELDPKAILLAVEHCSYIPNIKRSISKQSTLQYSLASIRLKAIQITT